MFIMRTTLGGGRHQPSTKTLRSISQLSGIERLTELVEALE